MAEAAALVSAQVAALMTVVAALTLAVQQGTPQQETLQAQRTSFSSPSPEVAVTMLLIVAAVATPP